MTRIVVLGVEPAPGDVHEIDVIATAHRQTGESARVLLDDLRSLVGGADDSVWRGDAADGFRAVVAGLVPDLEHMELAHGRAGRALAAYSATLADAQDRARNAANDAEAATVERQRAVARRDRASQMLSQAQQRRDQARQRVWQAAAASTVTAIDPALSAHYRSTMYVAQQDEAAAAQAVASASTERSAAETEIRHADARIEEVRRRVRLLGETCREAARRAADELGAATPGRGSLLSWFGRSIDRLLGGVDDWDDEVAALVAGIVNGRELWSGAANRRWGWHERGVAGATTAGPAQVSGRLNAWRGVEGRTSGSVRAGSGGVDAEGQASVRAGVGADADGKAVVGPIAANGRAGVFAGARAEADGNLHLGADGASAKVNGDAFAGAEASAKGSVSAGGATASAGATAYAGAGVTGSAEAKITKDKITAGFKVGAALGVGAGYEVSISIEPAKVVKNLNPWD